MEVFFISITIIITELPVIRAMVIALRQSVIQVARDSSRKNHVIQC